MVLCFLWTIVEQQGRPVGGNFLWKDGLLGMNNSHCGVSIVAAIVDWAAAKEIMGRMEEATLRMVSQPK